VEKIMNESLTGGCSCRSVRYEITKQPMFVHCCHCHLCQQQTGSAFITHVFTETEHIEFSSGTLKLYEGETGSGKPHQVERCEKCSVAIRSFYHGHKGFCLVKGGTLDNPSSIEPNLHLFTQNKVPWIEIPDGVKVFEEDYDAKEVWPVESFERLMRAIG
jgi:hypothetical protein